MATRNYSSDKIAVSWLGIQNLAEGADGDGDWFTTANNNPRWTVSQDRVGNMTRNYDARRAGTITINVKRSSAVSSQLHAIAAQDRIARDQVGHMTVFDANKKETYIFSNAFILDEPPPTFGQTDSTEAWTFAFEKMDVPQVTPANLIGS